MKLYFIVLFVMIILGGVVIVYGYSESHKEKTEIEIVPIQQEEIKVEEKQATSTTNTLDLEEKNDVSKELTRDGFKISSRGDTCEITKQIIGIDLKTLNPKVEYYPYRYGEEWIDSFDVPTNSLTASKNLDFQFVYNITCSNKLTQNGNMYKSGNLEIDFDKLTQEYSKPVYECVINSKTKQEVCSIKSYDVKPQSYNVVSNKDNVIVSLKTEYKTAINLGDKIALDPTYTITNLTINAVLNNVVCEGGGAYCHLGLNNSQLLVYMPSDVNTTIIYDWSNYNADGTATSTRWMPNGKYGGSLNFTSLGSTVNIPEGNMRGLRQFSLATWFYDVGTGTYGGGLFSKHWGTTNGEWYLYVDTRAGSKSVGDIRFTHINTTSNRLDCDIQNIDWGYGTWNHIVATYNGSLMSVYFNNSLIGTCNHTGWTKAYGRNVVLGKYEADNSWQYLGLMDEVMIFNWSLSADEINQIYTETYPRFVASGNLSLNFSDYPQILHPPYDTRIRRDSPTVAYGGGTGNISTWINTGGSYPKIIMRYDLSSLVNATILNATLIMRTTTETLDVSEGYNMSVFEIYPYPRYNISGADWNEDTLTYNNAPNTTDQYNFTEESTASWYNGWGDMWVNWKVTDIISRGARRGYVDMLINATDGWGTPNDDDYLLFISNEPIDITKAPYLQVEYILNSINLTANLTLQDYSSNISVYFTNLTTSSEPYNITTGIKKETTFTNALNITFNFLGYNQFYSPILLNGVIIKLNNITIISGVDSTPPIITINHPTMDEVITSFPINFTLTLNEQGSSCVASFDNFLTNYSMQKGAGNLVFNYSNGSIADGYYTVNFSCNDTSNNINSTAYINFSMALAADTCTYSGSGNWAVNCADDCTITTNTDLGGNNLLLTGTTGAEIFTIDADIININQIIESKCRKIVLPGHHVD